MLKTGVGKAYACRRREQILADQLRNKGSILLTLTLNTSEKRVQFMLSRGADLLCAQDWQARRSGTELLMPVLVHACERLGLCIADIRHIACVAGPGSFTGIRLAVVTSAALARANQARQAGLDYLCCLAAGVCAPSGARIQVLTHARNGLAYCGRYLTQDNGPPRPQAGISLMSLSSPVFLPEEWVPDYILGSALPGCREWFSPRYPAACLLPPACDYPVPAGLMAVVRAVDWNAPENAGDIQPLYLRECDAVDNLESIARAQGCNPDTARARLQSTRASVAIAAEKI